MRYTYSRWDESRREDGFDADELMDALADDLISDGDVASALQRVVRWGLEQGGDDPRRPGLHALLQRLRAQRQSELERYDLDSLLGDITERVRQVVEAEREGIRRRREAHGRSEGPEFEALQRVVERKEQVLNDLPEDVGAAVQALNEYEFLDQEARAAFQQLMETVQDQILASHWQAMEQSLRDLSGETLQGVKEMLRSLNGMLSDRLAGREPDFDRFRRQYGHYFPPADSLESLIEHIQEQTSFTQSLLGSMSPDMRQSLERLMQAALQDPELRDELGGVTEALNVLSPLRRPHPQYPFTGEESLTVREALALMRRLHELAELETDLTVAQDTGRLEHLDLGRVEQLMGEDAARAAADLQNAVCVLEQAGYVQVTGDTVDLTPRGVRRIGQKALRDIFRNMKGDAFGAHATPLPGPGVDRADQTKVYEYGDPFLLDMQRTLMNSLQRKRSTRYINLDVGDFEVFRTEYLTQSSTVLMLDLSRSMPLRGCFVAAKKVAFALHSLIRVQYPRDQLFIIGFSDFARELRPDTLHHVTWGDYVYGTNMQHGFILARKLLSRQKVANKQIILITDGEPTAHFEGDRVHFSYPPTFRTFQETLREVKRCTQDGIVINTFMLERSHYLADFVDQMTRINRGRAFYATPERLGDYVLVDYVSSKGETRTVIAGRGQ